MGRASPCPSTEVRSLARMAAIRAGDTIQAAKAEPELAQALGVKAGLMGASENFFVEELKLFLAHNGETLQEEASRVLASDPEKLGEEEGAIYDELIRPAERAIKYALRVRLGFRDVDRDVWESNYLQHYRTVIGRLASEVLELTEPSARGTGAAPGAAVCVFFMGERDAAAMKRLTVKDAGGYDGEGSKTTSVLKERPSSSEPGFQQAEAAAETGPDHAAESGKASRRKAVALSAKAVGWVLTIGLALMLLVTAFLMVAPKFGLHTYAVLSGSMEPTLRVGGMTICRSVPVDEVAVGDIIVVNNPDGVRVSHRVIDIREEEGKRYFQTKGDANEDPDPDVFSIRSDTVDKVVCHLPYLGFFASFMRSKLAFLAFILIPGLILIILFGKDMWMAVEEVREKRKGGARSADERAAEGGKR